MEQSLRVQVAAEVLPGPVHIIAEGQLTADSCQTILDVLEPAITLNGCPSITIDMSAVTHVEHGGLQRLEHYIAPYQDEKKLPTVAIVGLPSTTGSAQRSQRHGSDELDPGNTTTVQELMSPIGPTVLASQLLGQVAHEIRVWGEPVVVLDISSQPLGVITADNLDLVALDDVATLVALDETAASNDATDCRELPCSRLIEVPQYMLRADDPVADVLEQYQRDTVHPLLVCDGQQAIGIVHPRTVLDWCADHDPNLLETLTHRAAQQGLPLTQAPTHATLSAKSPEDDKQ